ncbi:MAG: hypothetical protein GQ525_12975, partial [Draconibacterium sp.]|nr:hypothetical protein [Draconibacterium sp.]
KDETDIYRVFDNVHNRFSIGIDEQGYIHVLGDMHHGNLGSKRNVSADNPLPARFNGSIGDQMYWVSDRPEDISSFTFVGFDSLKAIPCNDLSYYNLESDLNGKLYMSSRQGVRRPRTHVPGTMGLSLWRYEIDSKSWKELGGIPDDDYGFSDADYVFPSILWEPHAYGREIVWYQNFSHSIKFDINNRLHLLSIINADDNFNGSTDVVYAYSDDGGDSFYRRDGTSIAPLPIRVTGPEANRGTILMHQGTPDQFKSEYFGLFWDRNFTPAFRYTVLDNSKSRYCYFDTIQNKTVVADFDFSVPVRHGNHCSLNNGSILFIGEKSLKIKKEFSDKGTEYYLSDALIPSGKNTYLIREVDDAVLLHRNILRGLSVKNGQSVVISIDLNSHPF